VIRELNGSGKAAERDALTAEQFGEIWQADETIGWIYQYYNDENERKQMREESSAPRNSRELAVRNQFFTPRYVVEFLTDNTLGRIWYEMTQGETKLKEQCCYIVRRLNECFLKPDEIAPEQPKQDDLSQGDLLKQPVHIPHRSLKDPRTILMLDPACGSMHFGLYARFPRGLPRRKCCHRPQKCQERNRNELQESNEVRPSRRNPAARLRDCGNRSDRPGKSAGKLSGRYAKKIPR
jgi:hypothetical protein